MRRTKKRFMVAVAFATALSLSSCSENSPGTGTEPGTEPGEPGKVLSLNGLAFGILSGDCQSDGSSIEGSCTVVFQDTLTEENNGYDLKVTLEPAGSIEIKGNAGPGLTKGNGMIFTRDENDNIKLEVNKGTLVKDITADLVDIYGGPVSALGELFLQVDIHGHGHNAAWINKGDQVDASADRVNGTVWGLTLTKAKLTYAKRGEPNDPH